MDNLLKKLQKKGLDLTESQNKESLEPIELTGSILSMIAGGDGTGNSRRGGSGRGGSGRGGSGRGGSGRGGSTTDITGSSTNISKGAGGSIGGSAPISKIVTISVGGSYTGAQTTVITGGQTHITNH